MMICITKQPKVVDDDGNNIVATQHVAAANVGIERQHCGLRRFIGDEGRPSSCFKGATLLLVLLRGYAIVALMSNATMKTPTAAAAAITTSSPTTLIANNIKAYELLKPAGSLAAATFVVDAAVDATGEATDAVDVGDAATTDFITLKINNKAAVSQHFKALAAYITSRRHTSTNGSSPGGSNINKNSSSTLTYIKRNMWSNNKSSSNIFKGHNNSNNNVAIAITATNTTTNSPTTIQLFDFSKITATNNNSSNFDVVLESTMPPKTTFEASATLYASPTTPTNSPTALDASPTSFYASPTSLYTTPPSPTNSPPSPTTSLPATNISFHEFCVSSRDSFADLMTIILYSIVCIVGLFGNTLVIYVVLRFSKMQTVTNIYILNLAIADECFLIGIPFLIYTMRICSWTFGEYMCKAYMVSTSITQFTSSIFLLIMSADRFIAVCHPIASPRYRTLNNAKYVSALAWLTSAVLMLPVILFASTVKQEDGIHYSCNIEWPERYKRHSGTTFILYTFFLGFATPLSFILIFYYLVIKKLHAVGRKHKSKEKKRSHRKVTRLVLTVITVYIMCWLPQWISQVALISSNPAQRDLSRLEVLIFLLLGCLAYSNSAMNPILYAFLSDNFRKSFSKAFTCMAGHEVNAQLQVEPSVFTKHGGSRRRGSSKRLVAQSTTKTKAAPQANPQMGNNNSSTTTSSTATQNDKNLIGVQQHYGGGSGAGGMTSTTTATSSGVLGASATVTPFHAATNGRVSAECVVLVLDKEAAVCATVIERSRNARKLSGSNTLQTDL